MMCSRVVIEQKIADLEIALNRQEELIRSQRDVLRGLKDLIAGEYATQWQSPVSQSYLQQGIALSNSMGASNPFLASMIFQGADDSHISPTNLISNTSVGVGKKSSIKHEVDGTNGEPAKKKAKANISPNSNDKALDQKNVVSSSF